MSENDETKDETNTGAAGEGGENSGAQEPAKTEDAAGDAGQGDPETQKDDA